MADETSDETLREILTRTRRIALVGASLDGARPSHRVGHYLVSRGFDVIPVNPLAVGETLFGKTVVANLAEAGPVDMVDIFRRSEAVPGIVEDALAIDGLKTIWMQLGVRHPEAASAARAVGITVVQDRCPAIEIPRLGL